MAAHRLYQTPREQLFVLAVQARRRGLSFDEFWDEAVRPNLPPITRRHVDPPDNCVVWPSDTADRNAERAATSGAREGWRRAYEGRDPLPREKALPILAAHLVHASDSSEELVIAGRAA